MEARSSSMPGVEVQSVVVSICVQHHHLIAVASAVAVAAAVAVRRLLAGSVRRLLTFSVTIFMRLLQTFSVKHQSRRDSWRSLRMLHDPTQRLCGVARSHV
mmetsp:Transcript_91743/g.182285  ORF Transcript_91743/g.182285 Transcript_91743/m.182285 type:complete len:101 (-) Transcript_91743:24-326(-)